MILSFNKENCETRDFVRKIIMEEKKHTLRIDKKGRWKLGNSIQFYAMNPRNGGILFAEGIVTELVYAHLIFKPKHEVKFTDICLDGGFYNGTKLYGTWNLVWESELNKFARNDGFENWYEMYNYFLPECPDREKYYAESVYTLIIWELTKTYAIPPKYYSIKKVFL